MLQIISGKFFTLDARHRTPGKGVFFSNYGWIDPVETQVGTLEPTDRYGLVNTYVFEYVNEIENFGRKAGMLVAVGDQEIKEQFRLLCMFGLKACFFSSQQD